MDRLGLSQLKRREKIVLMGDTGSGKTYSMLTLAQAFPGNLFYIIDPDDGVSKVLDELGGDAAFPNVEYRLTVTWEEAHAAFIEAHQNLGEGDWLMFEQLGKMWEMAQNYYSIETFQIPAIDKLLGVKKAEAKVKSKVAELKKQGVVVEEKGSLTPGGFEPGDWVPIKQLHNQLVMDMALARGSYNVLSTTGIRDILPIEKKPKSEFQKAFLELFMGLGVKPEGEKHNLYRYDTIVGLRKKGQEDRTYVHEAGVVKDRGRRLPGIEWIDTTDVGFWLAYRDWRETSA